ncbi:MAG: molybdenum ABC transporter ATP-binding protein [Chloroflexi bacterium]|nr:molybdenum ABC transporter ATP-binding protein [Chloroflexota bacterium]
MAQESAAHLPPPRLSVDVDVRLGGFQLRAAAQAGAEVLVLFGPSGSGKTTLLNAIAGLVRPDAGEIRLDGRVLFRRGSGAGVDVAARARRVGYVFQSYALFPHMTVAQNVAYPLPKGEARGQRVGELLERTGLAELALRYPRELSGGQQQRVAIARALAAEPHLLLLDEPFSSLDAELRRSLRGELRRMLAHRGIPVVLVTHDREDALALGDRVVALEKGRVVLEGPPLQVLGQPPTSLMARLVGVENLYQARVVSRSPQSGTMMCRVGSTDLEALLAEAGEGEEVIVGLRSRDVMLANQRPVGLSARNVLPGRVATLESRSPGVQVTVECGNMLVASQVTHEAVQELGLAQGRPVWAVIKASSLFLVSRDT